MKKSYTLAQVGGGTPALFKGRDGKFRYKVIEWNVEPRCAPRFSRYVFRTLKFERAQFACAFLNFTAAR